MNHHGLYTLPKANVALKMVVSNMNLLLQGFVFGAMFQGGYMIFLYCHEFVNINCHCPILS